MSNDISTAPRDFQEVLRSLKGARVRGEVALAEAPAPSRIAPFAVAVNGEIDVDGELGASGRFLVLHDPAGQDAWGGTLRVIALVKAEIEREVGADEMWAQVAWSWINESLADLTHSALGGTVTKVTNESFGDLENTASEVRIEMRISWTPEKPDMAPHIKAWANLLATCAGVPPLPEGVTMLRGKTA